MRAFKKLMAGMIATAIAATLATSAFAAELSEGKMVLSEGETYAPAAQTTVLVVPYDNWVSDAVTNLADADILYIDQWETAAEAEAAIAEGLGVMLTDGKLADINAAEGEADYYVLFGGNTNEGEFEIRAFGCVIGEVENVPTIAWCDVNRDGSVNTADATQLIRYIAEADAWAEVYQDDAEKLRVCNVNTTDSVINTADATQLIRYIAEADPWPTAE